MPRICVTFAVTASLLLLGAPAANAAPPTVPLADCAPTVTPDEVLPGDDAVGFTVRQGETVESFDAVVQGVLPDAIAPGRDLVVVKASGPVIDAGGGENGAISAGMSGSPVYTLDGELIGAIAYGFSYGPSPIAGVTPADPDMLAVFDEPDPLARSGAEPKRVRLSAPVRRQIARTTSAPKAALDEGLARLKVPLAVSGSLMPSRLDTLREAARKQGLPMVVTPGASAQGGAPVASIAPGDAFTAALSYGDVTFAGIGTATYVCDGRAVAFGHPFSFHGPTQLGASRASVLTVVDDPFGPYKLAVPTDPVGLVDRDRLAAIRAQLGQVPPTVPITQDTTALDTGVSRLGSESDVVQALDQRESVVPDVAFTHGFANIDSTFDQISGGSSLVRWKIRGIRTPSGRPWSIRRENRFTSRYDISFGSMFELAGALYELQRQDLAEIEFTGVDIDVEVERTVRQLRIEKVRWSLNGGRFLKTREMVANRGDHIRAKVSLEATDNGSRKTVELGFKVPQTDANGVIEITGGDRRRGGIGDLLCALAGHCGRDHKKPGFGRLLESIADAPRNHDLTGTAHFKRHKQDVTKEQDRVVTGSKSLRVIVGGDDGDGDVVAQLKDSR